PTSTRPTATRPATTSGSTTARIAGASAIVTKRRRSGTAVAIRWPPGTGRIARRTAGSNDPGAADRARAAAPAVVPAAGGATGPGGGPGTGRGAGRGPRSAGRAAGDREAGHAPSRNRCLDRRNRAPAAEGRMPSVTWGAVRGHGKRACAAPPAAGRRRARERRILAEAAVAVASVVVTAASVVA